MLCGNRVFNFMDSVQICIKVADLSQNVLFWRKKLDLRGRPPPQGITLIRKHSYRSRKSSNPRIPTHPNLVIRYMWERSDSNYALDMGQTRVFFWNAQINCATSGQEIPSRGSRTLAVRVPSAQPDQPIFWWVRWHWQIVTIIIIQLMFI